MELSNTRRLVGPILLGATLATAAGCSGAAGTVVDGTVSGTSLSVKTAYWGGPFIVFTDRKLDCRDLAWVARGYTPNESPVGFDMVTMQVTFNNSDVAVGPYNVTGDAPVTVSWLTTESGAFNQEKARTGYVNVDDITGKEHAVGDFDLTFDDGSVEGSFDLAYCSNLKDH